MAQTYETTQTTAGVEPEIASNRLALIAIAGVLATVTNAVAFMLPPLLPLITTSYAHNSVTAASWVFSSLILGGGAGFALIPRLTDMMSDRAITLWSGAFLTGGALAVALLDSYAGLVIGSALMGFGSASQLISLSFLRRHLGSSGLSTSVSVLIMATGTGVVLGMVGGGASVRIWPMPNHLTADGGIPHQSLAPFFYILAALFILTTIGLLVIVPNSPAQSRGRIGVLGTLWLTGWVIVILLPLSAPQNTWLGRNALLVLALGIALAVGWALAERRAKAPVFDLKLLRKPFVTTACLSAGLFGCIDAAFLVLVNYYIQNPDVPGLLSHDGGKTGWPTHIAQYGLNDDPLKTSIILLPFALTMFLSGKASERIVAKGKPGLVLVVGAAICVVGLLFLALFHDQTWHYVVGSAIVGLGSRAGYSGAYAVPQFAVAEERAGMAAGMPGTMTAIGFAVGASVITMLQNASGFVYHSMDANRLGALAVDPSKARQLSQAIHNLDLSQSDYLLDGTHFALAHVYTDGYWISLLFPALVIVATAISRLRNPNGFKLMVTEAA
jgi:MFS family permease